ncbi:MAG: integrase arm-type DNA-binding domain-containing protein [Rhodobacteraceae bacterium]|nr:integrase arm-type DNA-binding domain-containing protein [Paracoccaceae bacterium]
MPKTMKLTKRAVDALKPAEARFMAWDSEISGFGLRVSPTGRKSYVFRYRASGGRTGRSREPVIGVHGAITPDQAREIARSWAALVAAGGDPAADRESLRKAPTVSNLLDRFITDHAERNNKPSTVRNVKQAIENHLRPALGRIKVRDVTRADISKLHGSLRSTPYQANRALALLSKAFSLAEVWGLRPDSSNPCMRVQRFEEKSRERFLSEKEFAALGEVLAKAERGELIPKGRDAPAYVSPQAIAAIRLLLFTGARVSEILGLRWEFINGENNTAELPDSKTGKKTIYLPPAALEVLNGLERPANGKGYVVRGGRGAGDASQPLVNIKKPWGVIRSAAGLDGVRLHDLRHSFASAAIAGGMSLPMIGALLGHRDVKTTARYAHLADDPIRAAAAQVGNRIAGAMKGESAGANVVAMRRK